MRAGAQAILLALVNELPCYCDDKEWRGRHAPDCVQRQVSYEDLVEVILRTLEEHDFFLGYVSRCWCEGKQEGAHHTPGCSGLAQEEKLHQLSVQVARRR
jgi:hypothetical protein